MRRSSILWVLRRPDFLLFWLIFGIAAPLAAQQDPFEMAIQNRRAGAAQAELLLSYNPALLHVDAADGSLHGEIDVTLSLRRPAGNVILEKRWHESLGESSMLDPNAFFRSVALDAAPGTYRVEVELHDRITGRRHLRVAPFTARPLEGPALSDIALIPEVGGAFFAQPLLGSKLPSLPEKLVFRSEVYLPKDSETRQFTARAVLYRKEARAGIATEADRFQSVRQINKVVESGGEGALFEGRFDLSELEDGEYLIEVFLYDDDRLLAESSRNFEVEWRYMKEVFSDLDHSLIMMAWVADSAWIGSVRAEPSADRKLERFLRFWEDRKAWGGGNAFAALKAYYTRIFEANLRFHEEHPGYLTDRGRTFVLYGAPDDQRSMTYGSYNYEVWTYKTYNLQFVFRDEGRFMPQVFPR